MAKIYLPNKEDITTLGGNIGPIVQSELDAVYAAVAAKGGTVPTEKTLGNLKTAVESITTDRMKDWIENTGLREVFISDATMIKDYAFWGQLNLSKIDFPNVLNVEQNAFGNCRSLVSIRLPLATSFKAGAFTNCSSLRVVNLPSAYTFTGNTAFATCSSLEYVRMPNINSIFNNTFNMCNALKFLNFRPQTSVGLMSKFRSTIFNVAMFRNQCSILCVSSEDGSEGYLAWDGTAWVFNAGDPDGYDPSVFDE